MCMRATEEGCVLAAQQEELTKRVTSLEHDVANIRAETQAGFKAGAEAMRQLNTSVSNLAHDFGQRFNNIEATVVAEKVEWGKTLRQILKWTARVVLAGCLFAMGVTADKAAMIAWKSVFN